MTFIRKIVFTGATLALIGGSAFADALTDQIIADLGSQGYERIEIRKGLSQTKVEAIRGTEKLEQVYDRSTGALLKQEMERVEAGDDTAPGLSVRERNRNFAEARNGRDDDDHDDDHGRGRDDDDDDDDDRDDDKSGRGGHDDHDDDHDDHDDDDHGDDDDGDDDDDGHDDDDDSDDDGDDD
jgi:hypothetical protein